MSKYAHHLSCVSSYQILQQMHSGTGCICWHPQTIAGFCFRGSYALLKIHNTQLIYNFVIIPDKTRYLVLVSEELFQSWPLIFVKLNQYAIQILWQQSSLLLAHAVYDVSKIQIFRSYVSLHVRISFFPFCLLEHTLKTHQLCTFSALAASFLGKSAKCNMGRRGIVGMQKVREGIRSFALRGGGVLLWVWLWKEEGILQVWENILVGGKGRGQAADQRGNSSLPVNQALVLSQCCFWDVC